MTVRPRVRLYRTVRTAHLERAAALPPATIVYRDRRADFDPALAEGLDLVRAGAWRAAWIVRRARELEVNEPLMRSALPRTALVLALLAVLRRRPVVGTYAIENADPFAAPLPPGVRGLGARAVRARDRILARRVALRVDRVVFGTDAARDRYAGRFRPGIGAVVPALPAPCACGAPDPAPGSVLFVGSFAPRKGLAELVAAWPHVAAASPGAHLTLVGTGPLLPLAREAAQRADVTLVVDPPRAEVHRRQRAARVAVLLSQPRPRWREQVGLPIVEGLAHGCTVVTTSETGLAGWLAAHGHTVIAPDAGPTATAAAIVAALAAARLPSEVLADLPGEDGRLAAERALFP